MSEVAELHRLERLVRRDLEERQVGLGVAADDFGFQRCAVVEDNVDLVGVGDDVIVGDHKAAGIDDEAGAERIDPARRLAAAWAVAVLEELIEEFLERRAGRQLRHGIVAHVHGLLGRDIDHRVDHGFRHVGDAIGAARRSGNRHCRPSDCGGGENRQTEAADPMRHMVEDSAHGRQFSWEKVEPRHCRRIHGDSRALAIISMRGRFARKSDPSAAHQPHHDQADDRRADADRP